MSQRMPVKLIFSHLPGQGESLKAILGLNKFLPNYGPFDGQFTLGFAFIIYNIQIN